MQAICTHDRVIGQFALVDTQVAAPQPLAIIVQRNRFQALDQRRVDQTADSGACNYPSSSGGGNLRHVQCMLQCFVVMPLGPVCNAFVHLGANILQQRPQQHGPYRRDEEPGQPDQPPA
ncbi:hypothetical protein D3C80_994560 [compost metagenome]